MCAPRETRLRAVSSLILPAPSRSTRFPLEILEDLLRERSRGRRDRGRALADRGLDPYPPAGVERLAEEAVEERAGRACFEGTPHLAENLALAGYERVEPGRHAEEMERGRLVSEPVEDGAELLRPVTRQLRQGRDRELLHVVGTGEV